MESRHNIFRGHATAVTWLGGFLLFAIVITLNCDFLTFVRYMLLGLPQGAIIALIAVGYSMVYGIIQLINFAHGEVFMFSAYFTLMLATQTDPFDKTTPLVVTGMVGLMFLCTAWVVLDAVRSRPLRILGAIAVGAAAALLNWYLMPRGGKVVLPLLGAWAVAVVYACCLGVTIDVLAYRPLRNSPRLIPLITAIGLSLLMQNLAQALFGASSRFFPEKTVPAIFISTPSNRIPLGFGLSMSVLDATIVVLAFVLMAGLQLFIKRSRTGKAMRACAQDRVTASLMGIKVNNVVALAFALGAGLAALVAPLYVIRGNPIGPQMGYIVGILAFSSAVLGGIGNITGAMLGGLIIGLIYSFVPLFNKLPEFKWFGALERAGWVSRAGYEHLVSGFGQPGQYVLGVAYAFMILVIVFKPTGLLGRSTAKRA